MTETSTPTIFSPADDPVTVEGERRIAATWNVGPADEDGWQPQARLVVDHWKGSKRYTAALRVGREKVEKRGNTTIVSELLNYAAIARSVPILERDASRFSRKTLHTVFETALTLLRDRFESSEDDVTAYFDPTSAVHAD